MCHKSHVKSENMKKLNVTKWRFQCPVYRKLNISVIQILNCLVKTTPYHT